MNLLITGALGHIGSKLIRSIPEGMFDRIVLIDNLSTQRYSSLFGLPRSGNFHFLEADILTVDPEKIFKGVDVVIHLAAVTNAEASIDKPEEVERVNFKGTERVARACAAHGSKLIFISTTSVYGVQKEEVDEDCSADQLKPQSPYAESKLKAEEMLLEMRASQGLKFVICRFGTIFGVSPGMRFHTAVNKFIWQACTGQPITVWRSAMDQNRPYLDLTDAVEALKFIMKRDLFDGRVYNIVTTNTSVRKILEHISAEIPDVSVQFVDSKIMNQLSYTVSSQRFRDAGFTFNGKLEQAVRETIDLLRGVRKW